MDKFWDTTLFFHASCSGMSWAMCMIGVRYINGFVIPSSLPLQGLRFTRLLRPHPFCHSHPSCRPKSPMDAAQNAKILRKEQLMSLPSLSCSLSNLPQARSVEQVQLHPSSMSAQLAAESEAKVRFALGSNTKPVFTPSPQLRKVLSKSGTPSHPSLIVTPPPNLPSSPSPQLMMKVCGHNFIFAVCIVPNPTPPRSSNPNKSPSHPHHLLSVVHRLWPAAGTVSAAAPISLSN